jgi:hypothetical protein
MKAAFRFGVLKGTMLLGPNEEPSDENSNSVKGSEDEESETESDFWNEERWEEIGRLQKETQRKESELLDAEKATMEHILKAAFGQYEVNNDEGNEPLTSTQIKERTRILTQQEKVKEAELAAAKDAELRGVVPQSRLFEQQVAQDLDLSGHDIGDPAMDAGGFEETDSEGRNTALGNAVDRQAVNERQTHTTKRKAPEPERPAKRRKIDTENRIWFQWRGRETGEGVIQLPSGNENRGYFDVCVAEATLDGSLSSDLIGRNKKFTAYKVSDEPRSWPEDWESFSEAAYERERNKRWY